MLSKIVLVVVLATLSVSLAKDEHNNELINAALGTGTNLLREFSKIVTDDAEKYSIDLNSLYKKYEISAKADQAKSFLQTQYKKGAEITNEYLKKADIESEEEMKKAIEIIKREDPVLGDKLTKFYEKSVDLDRIAEDIVKYVLDADRVNGALEKAKAALHPLEHKLIDAVKKFETIVLEHLPKKGKGKK